MRFLMKATPRSFYRWKSFWLGLCVLVFLGWAWLGNVRAENNVGYRWYRGTGELSGWVAGSCLGSVYVSNYSSPPRGFSSRAPASGFHWLHEALEADEPTIYFARQPFGNVRESKYRERWVAWWLVFLGYTAMWSAWLFLHWKREQKKGAL